MSNLKNVTANVNIVSEARLRASVIKFLKASHVPLEARKKLIKMINSDIKKALGLEVYPGVFITPSTLDIIYNRKFYEAPKLVVDIIEDSKITEQSAFRQCLINHLKEWGYEFSVADLKNTRIWSAIDNTAKLAGYQLVNARPPKESGTSSFYRKFKKMEVFSQYSKEQMYSVAERNIIKVEKYYKNKEGI